MQFEAVFSDFDSALRAAGRASFSLDSALPLRSGSLASVVATAAENVAFAVPNAIPVVEILCGSFYYRTSGGISLHLLFNSRCGDDDVVVKIADEHNEDRGGHSGLRGACLLEGFVEVGGDPSVGTAAMCRALERESEALLSAARMNAQSAYSRARRGEALWENVELSGWPKGVDGPVVFMGREFSPP